MLTGAAHNRLPKGLLLGLTLVVALGWPLRQTNAKSPAEHTTESAAWCAPELEALPSSVCAWTSSGAISDTLVLFLHGVIQPDSGWQYQQQRAIARAAHQNGFDVLMPRGRQGVGPPGMRDWWTWPTSVAAQQQVEQNLLSEWQAARTALEERRNKPYARVFVFGFSNGAYYASQLVLRGKLPGQGAALFAGGSGGKWLERYARAATTRVPVYLQCSRNDKSAVSDVRKLGRMLQRLGWPHRFVERPTGGHSMPDAGVKSALQYLMKRAN